MSINLRNYDMLSENTQKIVYVIATIRKGNQISFKVIPFFYGNMTSSNFDIMSDDLRHQNSVNNVDVLSKFSNVTSI